MAEYRCGFATQSSPRVHNLSDLVRTLTEVCTVAREAATMASRGCALGGVRSRALAWSPGRGTARRSPPTCSPSTFNRSAAGHAVSQRTSAARGAGDGKTGHGREELHVGDLEHA